MHKLAVAYILRTLEEGCYTWDETLHLVLGLSRARCRSPKRLGGTIKGHDAFSLLYWRPVSSLRTH